MTFKIAWKGLVVSVQPRIRLTRSFDQRSHSYLGYVLRIDGTCGEEERLFAVAIGKAAQSKHLFRADDTVSGLGVLVAEPRREVADLYKISRLKAERPSTVKLVQPPPFLGVPPELPTYRERGHRRLAARTFANMCVSCMWACEMAVEVIIDHWNPKQRRYRRETFCYGPKSCPLYKSGPTRKVPGRRGMSYEEEDWVDEEATAHRGEDE